MATDPIETVATEIATARLAGRPIDSFPVLDTLERGYAAQRRANAILERDLGARAGHKIGGTTAPMRAYLGLPEPVGGEVFASTVHPPGAELPLATYRRAGIETEIAVRLGRDLPPRGAPYTRADAAAAIDAVMAAIEVVDDRYLDFKTLGAPSLAADNAFNAGSVLGPPVAPSTSLDLGALQARTIVDGREVAAGPSSLLLGHPLDALAWLAERRSTLGLGLKAGEFVSLGSITPVQWIDAGPAAFRIEVEGLGSVEVAFA